MFYYMDPTYILVLIGAVICMIASANVKSTYQRFAQVRSMTGMTGAQVAERLLRSAGIHDVRVGHVSGELSDHYDPTKKVVNLSDSVYGSASVAAIGVAAHECGHAIQHAKKYAPLNKIGSVLPTYPLVVFQLLLPFLYPAYAINFPPEYL